MFMLLVAQFRSFYSTRSPAFTLIPPTCMFTFKHIQGSQWNPCLGTVGISSCSVGTLLLKWQEKSSSQHLTIGSFVTYIVAAAPKFSEVVFSRTLFSGEDEKQSKKLELLVQNFLSFFAHCSYLHGPLNGNGGIWSFVSCKVSQVIFDMQLILQH